MQRPQQGLLRSCLLPLPDSSGISPTILPPKCPHVPHPSTDHDLLTAPSPGHFAAPPLKPHPPTTSSLLSRGISPLSSIPTTNFPPGASSCPASHFFPPQRPLRPILGPAPPRRLTPLGRFFTISRDIAATETPRRERGGSAQRRARRPMGAAIFPASRGAWGGTAHAPPRRTRMLVRSNGPLATGPAGAAGAALGRRAGKRRGRERGRGRGRMRSGVNTLGFPRRARLQLPGPSALLGWAAGGSSAPAAPGSGDAEFVRGMALSASMSRLKVVREQGGKGDRGFGPGKLRIPGFKVPVGRGLERAGIV